MSRLGKRPIPVADNLEVKIENGQIAIKGPKGELTCAYDQRLSIEFADQAITVSNTHNDKDARSKHGLYWSLINNMITGVTEGYTRELELVGIGYRVQMKGNSLDISLGFSHPVIVDAPEGVNLATEGNNKIIVSGIDKQLVGQVAANIRKLRSPDPYKGKGIRYKDEYVRKKQGKSVKK